MTDLYGRADFARVLNAARHDRGLSVREAARIADVPSGTLQGWLSGRHFPVPALRENCQRLLEALDLGEAFGPDLWVAPGRAPRGARTGEAPYVGLRAFGVIDADLFHGRRAESERLATLIAQTLPAGLVAVIGASGAGKSSLVAAGVLGHECVDGVLAGTPARLASPDDLSCLSADVALVVVDQFEDVLDFPDPLRASVIERIVAAARDRVVVIVLRADYFATASGEPLLASVLERPFLVKPLTREELQEVIVAPARDRGVEVEPELVALLMAHLAPEAHIQHGTLPLLSSALLATWRVGKGNRMTAADFSSAGGVASAVDDLAEGVYASLGERAQESVRPLFLTLVRFVRDQPQRVPLGLAGLDAPAREVVAAFVEARLLRVDAETVRISHDALIRHWGRLKTWLDASEADLKALSRLQRATQLWLETGREPSALLPPERIEATADWLASVREQGMLSPDEEAFVEASEAHFASVLQHERLVNGRLSGQRRALIAAVALASFLAALSGVQLFQVRGLAEELTMERNVAQSRQVAVVSGTLRQQDPSLQAMTGLVAGGLGPTREGVSALIDATSSDVPTRWLGAPTSTVVNVGDELLVRANGDGHARYWRGDEVTTRPGSDVVLVAEGTPIYALAGIQLNGRLLVAAGGPDTRSLWDFTDEPRKVAELRVDADSTFAAAFSPDGTRLAFGTGDGNVHLYQVAADGTPHLRTAVRLDAEGDAQPAVSALVWGPGGRLLVGGPSTSIAQWEVGDEVRRVEDISTQAYSGGLRVLGLAWQGDQIVAGTRGTVLLRWRWTASGLEPLPPVDQFTSWVNSVHFSEDGRVVLAGSSDQSALEIDAASGQVLRALTGPSIVTGVTLWRNRPVTASTDGALRVWPDHSPLVTAGSSPVYLLASDGAETLIAGGTGRDGIKAWRWPSRESVLVAEPELPPGSVQSGVAAFTPDGRVLLGGSRQGQLLSWRSTSSGFAFVSAVPGLTGNVTHITTSPDSELAAATASSGTSTLLYRVDGDGRVTVASELDTPSPQMSGFSRDGMILAVALADSRVRLFDVSDPLRPTLRTEVAAVDGVPLSLIFSPKSDLLAVGQDNGIVTVWDVARDKPVLVNSFHDSSGSVYGVSFSPDGSQIAASASDQRLWGWSVGPGGGLDWSLASTVGRPWDVRWVGDTLLAAGDHGVIQTWIANPSTAREALCAAVGDPLQPSEWERHMPGVPPHDSC